MPIFSIGYAQKVIVKRMLKHLRDADHSKRNFPVTASMSAFLPGPIARTVLDPANTCVRPASATINVGIPRCSAVSFSLFLIIEHRGESMLK